jgi:hypothetical protein
MEYEKKSKKGKRKGHKDDIKSEPSESIETQIKEKFKNYFDLEAGEISKDNLQKFLFYIEKYEQTIKLKESKNFSELYDLNMSNVSKIFQIYLLIA